MTQEIAPRARDDVARGVLRILIGGGEKQMPTLKLAASGRWVELCADKIGPFTLVMASDNATEAVRTLTTMTQATILDLVLAYDATAALGGREWLEENADPEELYTALRQMGQVALPFVNGVGMLHEILDRVERVVRLLTSSKSTNGASPTGASAAKRSKRASTPSR